MVIRAMPSVVLALVVVRGRGSLSLRSKAKYPGGRGGSGALDLRLGYWWKCEVAGASWLDCSCWVYCVILGD